MMLSLFRKTWSKKTVFRNDLCYNFLGINSTDNVVIGYRFNNLLKSYSRNSFSIPNINQKEWSGAYEISEEDEATSHENTLFCNYDEFSGTSKKAKKIKNILKEDNLNLFKEIANGDDSVFELLKQIQVKLDILSCKYGVKVETEKKHWLEFLEYPPNKRKSYAASLIVNTFRNIQKQCEKSVRYDLPDLDEDQDSQYYDDVRCYHLFHNAMFLKLRPSAIKKMYYSKGIAAILHSPSLIFDCSYDKYMTLNEIRELARQLVSSASLNIKSENPFHCIFCNLNKDDRVAKYLENYNPIIFSDEYPVTVTGKSYIDMYDKSALVYLTPHCQNILKRFEPDKIYIVGAFVDKSVKKPVSLAKAKEQGIAMAKFPIDTYLDWGLGNKCLSLPHVTQIMLDLITYNGDWNKAFRVIPKRCLEKQRVKVNRAESVMASVMKSYDGMNIEVL